MIDLSPPGSPRGATGLQGTRVVPSTPQTTVYRPGARGEPIMSRIQDWIDVVTGEHKRRSPTAETTPVAGSHRMRFAMVHEQVQEVCRFWIVGV